MSYLNEVKQFQLFFLIKTGECGFSNQMIVIGIWINSKNKNVWKKSKVNILGQRNTKIRNNDKVKHDGWVICESTPVEIVVILK